MPCKTGLEDALLNQIAEAQKLQKSIKAEWQQNLVDFNDITGNDEELEDFALKIDNLYKEADIELVDDEVSLSEVQLKCPEDVHTSY